MNALVQVIVRSFSVFSCVFNKFVSILDVHEQRAMVRLSEKKEQLENELKPIEAEIQKYNEENDMINGN